MLAQLALESVDGAPEVSSLLLSDVCSSWFTFCKGLGFRAWISGLSVGPLFSIGPPA